MKVAITGGSGFIGQYLVQSLKEKYEVVVLTTRLNIDLKELVSDKTISYRSCNYSVENLIEKLTGCVAVIHLGAKRSATNSENQFSEYLENLQTSERLFEACFRLGITNVVNISTIAVYNQLQNQPFQESQSELPMSYYGICKLTIEKIANLYNMKGMCIKSLRVAQVLGYGERDGYMLSIFLKKAMSKETLSVYGRGESSREYIYVKDVVIAIECALEKEQLRGTYNIGTGKSISNSELAKLYCEVFDNYDNYVYLNKQEQVVKLVMNIEKAKNDLNYKAKYTIREALLDIKDIIKAKEKF